MFFWLLKQHMVIKENVKMTNKSKKIKLTLYPSERTIIDFFL